jgi:hypothetical protein
MKITINPHTNAFKPVRVEMLFESQAEMDAFASLFNNGTVAAALREQGFEPRPVWAGLHEAGADVNTPMAYGLTRIPD